MNRRTMLAIVTVLAAAVFTARGSWPWRAEAAVATPTLSEIFTETFDTLRRGETLGDLFGRQGAPAFRLSVVSDSGLIDPRRLPAGLVFNFQRRSADSMPTRVVVRTSPEQRVTLWPVADGWVATASPVLWWTDTLTLGGSIANSLYEALDAEVPDSLLPGAARVQLAWDLADVFAWQIDFTRDLREGDHFAVAVERLRSEEGEVRFGRVLAGELSVAGDAYSAYSFARGETRGYFDGQGRSLRRAFLLAPVQFRRISSRVGSRRHPILGTIRRHQGIDYAADPGTEVRAAGDGVVRERGWAGGYGNLIELRHRNGITTRYGHLRGFARGLSVGDHVKQGEVIGYVGSTGLATGPHLHYEFRVNGVARDPRRVDTGTGEPVPADLQAEFSLDRARLFALMHPQASPSLAFSAR